MAFLRLTWRIIRAALIICAALACMIVASFTWPRLLVLAFALPQSTGRVWQAAARIKVF